MLRNYRAVYDVDDDVVDVHLLWLATHIRGMDRCFILNYITRSCKQARDKQDNADNPEVDQAAAVEHITAVAVSNSPIR